MSGHRIDLGALSAGVAAEAVDKPQVVVVESKGGTTQEDQPIPGKTVAHQIDLDKLAAGGTEVVVFNFLNSTAGNLEMRLGTAAGILGESGNYGQAQSAIDNPGFLEQTVGFQQANAPKLNGFMLRSNRSGLIVSQVTIFTADNGQRSEQANRLYLDLDSNDCRKTGRLTKTNTEDNFSSVIKALIPMNGKNGFTYTARTGIAFQMELVIAAEEVATLKAAGNYGGM